MILRAGVAKGMGHTLRHFKLSVVALVILASLVPGCVGPRGGFSFVVTADMRYFTPPNYPGSDYFVGVCEAVRDVGPGEFMVSPGDFDPPAPVRAAVAQVLGEDYLWYPVVGNHEGDKPESMAFLRSYNPGGEALRGIVRRGPPGAVETCYAFDHGNAHFIAINQYYDGARDMIGDGDVSDALYEWLARDLAENDRPLVFVFGHEPAVVVPDMDNGRLRHLGTSLDKYPENNHRFWTLLRRHKVVAYFCGHTHNTSVAKINGVWQIDCGHARGLGDPGARSSFVKMYVEPDGVRCEVYRTGPVSPPPLDPPRRAKGMKHPRYRLTYSERLR